MIWIPTTLAAVLFVRCIVLELRTQTLEYKLARLRSVNAFLRGSL